MIKHGMVAGLLLLAACQQSPGHPPRRPASLEVVPADFYSPVTDSMRPRPGPSGGSTQPRAAETDQAGGDVGLPPELRRIEERLDGMRERVRKLRERLNRPPRSPVTEPPT